MNTTNNTSKLVILGLMTGILLLMAYTPLGYLNIGPLAITFNVIPVAIAAITLRSDRCSLRHDQLFTVHRHRRQQCDGRNAFQH